MIEHQFVTLTNTFSSTTEHFVEEEEFHYLKNVLRRKEGDTLLLLDGQGSVAEGYITDINKKSLLIKITDFKQVNPIKRFDICVGTLKPQNIESLLNLLPQIPFVHINFIRSTKSQGPLIVEEKLKKWKRLARESLRITHCPWETNISSFPSLTSFMSSLPQNKESVFIICEDDKNREPLSFKNSLSEIVLPQKKELFCFIGPESGWTEEEKELLYKNKSIPLTLSPYTLSSLSACLMAGSLISSLF